MPHINESKPTVMTTLRHQTDECKYSVLQDMTPFNLTEFKNLLLYRADGDNKFLRNVGTFLP
jgi:hypothetical protein